MNISVKIKSIISAGPEVIKLEYSLKLKIKYNDWLLEDTCPQVANHCALFYFVLFIIGRDTEKQPLVPRL